MESRLFPWVAFFPVFVPGCRELEEVTDRIDVILKG